MTTPNLPPREPEDVRYRQAERDDLLLQRGTFTPPRSRWPGVLAAGIIGIGVAAVVYTSFHSPKPSATMPDPKLAKLLWMSDTMLPSRSTAER